MMRKTEFKERFVVVSLNQIRRLMCGDEESGRINLGVYTYLANFVGGTENLSKLVHGNGICVDGKPFFCYFWEDVKRSASNVYANKVDGITAEDFYSMPVLFRWQAVEHTEGAAPLEDVDMWATMNGILFNNDTQYDDEDKELWMHQHGVMKEDAR